MGRTSNHVSRLKLGLKKVVTTTKDRVQKHRKPILIGLGVTTLVVAGAVTAVRTQAFKGNPFSAAKQAAASALRPSVESLVDRIEKTPTDGSLWMDLGDARFEKGQKASALHAYSRAMELKAEPSDTMLENLIASFGGQNEEAASAILTRYKLDEAESGLHALTSHRTHKTRWAALKALEKMRQASRNDYIRVSLKDLNEPDCSIRKDAVQTLAEHGDRSVLKAIRAADEKDESETPMFLFSCLGTKPERAEQAILTRK